MCGVDNSHFGTIKTNLENNMACGSDIYPKTNDKTVGLLNNYHVSKQLALTTQVKEDVTFIQTSSNTKTTKTKNKRESYCLHLG